MLWVKGNNVETRFVGIIECIRGRLCPMKHRAWNEKFWNFLETKVRSNKVWIINNII